MLRVFPSNDPANQSVILIGVSEIWSQLTKLNILSLKL